MTSVDLQQAASGIVLPVRVHAGARRNAIAGVHSGALKVAVTQAAERGKANKAVVEVICDALMLRRPQLELLRGATSPQKLLIVREIGLAELQRRIAAALQTI